MLYENENDDELRERECLMMKDIVCDKTLSALGFDSVFGNDSIINMRFLAEGYVILEMPLCIQSENGVFLPLLSSYLDKQDNCYGVFYVSNELGMIQYVSIMSYKDIRDFSIMVKEFEIGAIEDWNKYNKLI